MLRIHKSSFHQHLEHQFKLGQEHHHVCECDVTFMFFFLDCSHVLLEVFIKWVTECVEYFLYAAWTASDPQSQALLVLLATVPHSKSRSRRVRGKITLQWGWWVFPSPHTHIPWARGLSCSRCRTQTGLVVSSIHSTSLHLPTVWLHLQVTTSCGLFKLVFQEMLSGCSSWGEAHAE